MKKREPVAQESVEARVIWRKFCAILDATERQYAYHVMPILVDLYRRHERACGHETEPKAAREDVVFLYEIHHIDDFGSELAARVKKVMREFELNQQARQALRRQFRLIRGGLKGGRPATVSAASTVLKPV